MLSVKYLKMFRKTLNILPKILKMFRKTLKIFRKILKLFRKILKIFCKLVETFPRSYSLIHKKVSKNVSTLVPSLIVKKFRLVPAQGFILQSLILAKDVCRRSSPETKTMVKVKRSFFSLPSR